MFNESDPRVMDWFDARNLNHLKAYKHLQSTGVWPEDFKRGKLCVNWQFVIMGKLADAYLDLMGVKYTPPEPDKTEIHTAVECETLPEHRMCWEDDSGTIHWKD